MTLCKWLFFWPHKWGAWKDDDADSQSRYCEKCNIRKVRYAGIFILLLILSACATAPKPCPVCPICPAPKPQVIELPNPKVPKAVQSLFEKKKVRVKAK